jgi:hypothetical protein
MDSRPSRIKQNRKWLYLYVVDGKEGYYPISVSAEHEDCVVDRQVLAVRLSGFFKGTHNNLSSIYECMSRPLVPNRGTRNLKSADFNLLNSLWK